MTTSEHLAEAPPAREAYPPPREGWSAVGVLSLLYLLSFMDRNIMALLAEPVQRDLLLSDFELGLLYGVAFAVFYSIAGLPLGWAIDRYKRRVVIWLGVLSWSIATMACGLSRNFVELFIARAGVGAGEAALVPGAQSILADMFPPERLGLPMSIYGLGNKVGGGLSLIIGGALIALFPVNETMHLAGLDLKGWQMVFIAAGLPGILISFAIFAIPEPARRRLSAERGGKATSFGDYFRFMGKNWRFLLGHHGGSIALLIVTTGISTWTPSFFVRIHGWKAEDIGTWLGVAMMVGPVIGIPIHGAIADRLFRSGRADAHLFYLRLAFLASIIPGILAYFVPAAWAAFLLITVSQALLSSYIGLFPAALQLMIPGDLRGKAASIALLVCGIAGMALGPTLVGFLTDHVFADRQKIGLSLSVCIGLVLPLSAVFITLAMKPMRERFRDPAA